MPLPQEVTAVYYVSADGKVTRLIDDLKAPNGVILSPDEKTLYVIPSQQAEMMAYPVEAPGKLGKGRVFCTLKQAEGKSGTGGDGLTVDSKGNLYITSGLGLQVYNPEGKLLGIIAFPEQPANVTFGGPELKTLYVTARTSLYTCPMEVKGHRFPGGTGTK
jgi:gluconolactonase